MKNFSIYEVDCDKTPYYGNLGYTPTAAKYKKMEKAYLAAEAKCQLQFKHDLEKEFGLENFLGKNILWEFAKRELNEGFWHEATYKLYKMIVQIKDGLRN
jgi:hypothetical protein